MYNCHSILAIFHSTQCPSQLNHSVTNANIHYYKHIPDRNNLKDERFSLLIISQVSAHRGGQNVHHANKKQNRAVTGSGQGTIETNRASSVAYIVKPGPTFHSSTTFQQCIQTLNLSVDLSRDHSLGQSLHDVTVSIFIKASKDILGALY